MATIHQLIIGRQCVVKGVRVPTYISRVIYFWTSEVLGRGMIVPRSTTV